MRAVSIHSCRSSRQTRQPGCPTRTAIGKMRTIRSKRLLRRVVFSRLSGMYGYCGASAPPLHFLRLSCTMYLRSVIEVLENLLEIQVETHLYDTGVYNDKPRYY